MSEMPGLFDTVPPEETGGAAARQLLLASAGTGKTYALAGQFAALLVLGAPPERVLATTFTRKAAGEILDRVLARVADAADAGEDGEDARGQIREIAAELEPGAEDMVTADHCRAVLSRLLRSIGKFQVRTLDAFFVRLAGLFSDQLEIAPGWRITSEVEERALTLEAIARLLETAEEDEQVELLRGIARGGAERSAADSMAGTVAVADVVAREATAGSWGRIEALKPPTEVALSEAIRTIVDFQVPVSKTGKPNGHWVKAHGPLAELLAGLDIERDETALAALMTKGLGAKALETMPEFRSVPLADDLVDALLVVHQLVASRAVESIRERNAATGRLLERYHAAERGLRTELSAWRFSDFQAALLDGPAGSARDGWLRDLAFRLDGRIDHLLLDEFQDTSPGQWRLLAPLAAEILAGGAELRTFFCVGDVKQSIYGWRGGEPRLLGRMAARHPGLDARSLTRSYRSSPVVLDAVNLVFDGMERRTVLLNEKRDAARRAAGEWVSAFGAHEAARGELLGAARLWAAPAKPDGGRELDSAIAFAVERIVELHDGHPAATIGVLLRTKKELAALRFALAERGVEASDEGGKPLTDTASVTWVLALLHLADHPADGIARLQVLRSPFAEELGLAGLEVETEDSRAAASLAARRLRRELTHGGLGAFVGSWADRLSEGLAPWDARRLDQLVELAQASESTAFGLRPSDFADFVRSKAVPDPSGARVKVMTIHASKGLEFDVVVLPDLGRKLDLNPKGILHESESETAPPHVLSVTPKKELIVHHGQLASLFDAARERAMTDALSALYVALTRAVHGLEMIVPFEQVGAETFSFAGLFVNELSARGDGDVGDGSGPVCLWQHADSSDDWCTGSGDGSGGSVPEEERVVEAPLVLEPGRSRPRHLRPSLPMISEDERSSRLGTLVHGLLEGIEWLDDGAGGDPRSDEELMAVCRRIDVRPDAPVQEAIGRYREALTSPVLQRLLQRPERGSARVLRERSFDVEVTDMDGAPRRMRGAMDRLVLQLDGDQVGSATVIDFKVALGPLVVGAAERFRPQLEAYASALLPLLGLESGNVRALAVLLGAGGEVRVEEFSGEHEAAS